MAAYRRACALILAFLHVMAAEKDYYGYELLAVTADHGDHVDHLVSLQDKHPQLDFWSCPAPRQTSNVLIPPHLLHTVKHSLSKRGIRHTTLQTDINRMVREASIPAHDSMEGPDRPVFYSQYQSYEQIQDHVMGFVKSHPTIAKAFPLNHTTFEGRTVIAMELGHPVTGNTSKPTIVLDFGVHAREWIATATSLTFIHTLLSKYDEGDAHAQNMLNNYTWYIIPCTNPDGYEYARNVDRLWRKNRRVIGDCVGVDLNRNLECQWNTTGVEQSCFSNMYMGPHPFSEAETRNIRDLVNSVADSLMSYMAVHSYSQALLLPWSFVNENFDPIAEPDNILDLTEVGSKMINAIEKPFLRDYSMGQPYQVIHYGASGTASDWVLLHHPGVYSYTFELRPDEGDPQGFILPASNIAPQGVEFYQSIQAMVQAIEEQQALASSG